MVLESIVHRLQLSRSRKDVVLTLMDSLRSFVGADGVSYFRRDEKGITDKESRGVAAVAIKRYLDCAQSGVTDPLLQTALDSGQAVQSRDFMGSGEFLTLFREAAEPWAYRQIAASPIVSSAGAISAIQCFRTGDASAFTEEELRSLMSVSIWASAAMTRVENQDQPEQPALTSRQREICTLLVKGLTNREIGKALSISENTIKSHLKEVFLRYGVSRRAELAGLLR